MPEFCQIGPRSCYCIIKAMNFVEIKQVALNFSRISRQSFKILVKRINFDKFRLNRDHVSLLCITCLICIMTVD